MEKLFRTVFLLLGSIYVSAEDVISGTSQNLSSIDDNNVTKALDLEGKVDSVLLQGDPKNRYLLYTQKNRVNYQELFMNNSNSISSSNFNPNVPTAFLGHGWMEDYTSDFNTVVTKAFLDTFNFNIIVVDWSWATKSNYVTAAQAVPIAGVSMGKFVTFVNSETGAKFGNMHSVGFSLGAHMVGNAGRSLATQQARITGLDPAGPLFIGNPYSIKKTDALYVEGMHTNRAAFGTQLDVGNTDFSTNGGYVQPGCSLDQLCSHNKAWQYFAATVQNNNLIGYGCENNLALSLNQCSGETLPMGNADLTKTGTGIYGVKTTADYPYV